MSKAALKKELKDFTPEQLTEVILNVYDSSKEAKAYLEFFLNPDPETFLKEKYDAIFKEIKRTRRGNISKCRISVIRNAIRQGTAYGLSPEYISRLMAGAISLLVSSERYLYYPATLFNGTYRLVSDYIAWAEKKRHAVCGPRKHQESHRRPRHKYRDHAAQYCRNCRQCRQKY